MIGVFIVLLALLWWIPTGFQKQIYVNSEGVKAKVVEVNNKGVYSTGMIQQGDQRCTIEILEGEHKGQQVEGMNLLTGKLEFDKMFKPGDEAWVLLELDSSNEVIFANMVDYYRIDQQIFLIGLFVILIIAFSGFTGVRTLLSFSFALFSIVKILIPCLLKGIPPLLVALMVGNLLTVITTNL